MNRDRTEKDYTVSFYPVPKHASLTISSDDNYVTAEELASVAMHLTIDNPKQKVMYWIRVESND